MPAGRDGDVMFSIWQPLRRNDVRMAPEFGALQGETDGKHRPDGMGGGRSTRG